MLIISKISIPLWKSQNVLVSSRSAPTAPCPPLHTLGCHWKWKNSSSGHNSTSTSQYIIIHHNKHYCIRFIVFINFFWLLLPMKLLWLLLLEMHPHSVSSNHNIHQRIRIINIIVIILTFWTAWQHIFPPPTTRLCSLYSSGGSQKSFLSRIT